MNERKQFGLVPEKLVNRFQVMETIQQLSRETLAKIGQTAPLAADEPVENPIVAIVSDDGEWLAHWLFGAFSLYRTIVRFTVDEYESTPPQYKHDSILVVGSSFDNRHNIIRFSNVNDKMANNRLVIAMWRDPTTPIVTKLDMCSAFEFETDRAVVGCGMDVDGVNQYLPFLGLVDQLKPKPILDELLT